MNNFPHSSDESSRPSRAPHLRVLKQGEHVGRTPPNSEEAEQYLLACIMLDGRDVMARCHALHFKPEWFYETRHQLIFEVLEELYRRGAPMEVANVAEELREKKQLDAVGGFHFLSQVSSRIPTTAQSGYFIEKVRDLAAMRAVLKRGTKLVEDVYNNSGGGAELGDQLELHQSWIASTLDMLRAGSVSMVDAAQAAYQRTLDKLAGKPDKSRWIFTGLAEFDMRFGPFDANNEDWLVVVGAFQGGAKSSFLRCLLLHNLRAGKTAQIFLLETGIGKMLELLACTAAGVNSNSLDQLPKDLEKKYRACLDEMHGYVGKTLWVCDEVLPVETLIARIDDHARRHGPADMIGVDHIHLLNSIRPTAKREQEMGYIAKLLARCGKRHNRTIFGLAQLNRSARADGKNTRPEPHNLRDSGEIEQAARRIVLLHTPDTDMRGAEQTKNQDQVMMEIYQAKHNNGRSGWREFWFIRSITRFLDIGDRELKASRAANPSGELTPGGATKDSFRKGMPK